VPLVRPVGPSTGAVEPVTSWTRRAAHATRSELMDWFEGIGEDAILTRPTVPPRTPTRVVPVPPPSPTYWTLWSYPMPDRARCQHRDSRNAPRCGKPSRIYYPQDNGSQPALCVQHAKEQHEQKAKP
jgi:hypothetical protein